MTQAYSTIDELDSQRRTWNELVAFEPQLRALELAILCCVPPTRMPEFWRGWETWKQLLQAFVGWEADRPELRSEAAYQVAYDHLWRRYEDAALLHDSHDDEGYST